jgi:hypothetical protein
VRSWKGNRPWAGVCLLQKSSAPKASRGKTS